MDSLVQERHGSVGVCLEEHHEDQDLVFSGYCVLILPCCFESCIPYNQFYVVIVRNLGFVALLEYSDENCKKF